MIKILNLNVVILLEYQKIKIFLQKVTFQIGRNKGEWIDLKGEEIVGTFYEKKLQKSKPKIVKSWKSN